MNLTYMNSLICTKECYFHGTVEYIQRVNEDVLDEDGTWTCNYDDESTESSSTASTYENVNPNR